MINTLALFLSPDERSQSRYMSDGKIMEYEPDLYIQGILMVSFALVIYTSKNMFFETIFEIQHNLQALKA